MSDDVDMPDMSAAMLTALTPSLQPTGEHKVLPDGYCPDCGGAPCLRTLIPYVGGHPELPLHPYVPTGDGTCATCIAALTDTAETGGAALTATIGDDHEQTDAPRVDARTAGGGLYLGRRTEPDATDPVLGDDGRTMRQVRDDQGRGAEGQGFLFGRPALVGGVSGPTGDPACPDCEVTHPWRDHGPLPDTAETGGDGS